ncbi:separin [Sceloporus undulatus]|uniref:separin n=1 Tax=Sceloporus undulatus TaxID=8520 RepID=UPI001C4C7B7E|nr:separin [Sceloporus undulatus]XP_042306171.1 separin [Sceloporus undulatus]
MKLFTVVDFVAQISTPEETLTLSSELKEYLISGAKNAETSGQASKQAAICDRILRACIHRFGESLDFPSHFKSLQTLGEMAYHGYVAARLQYVPLYLERLLYHLLKGAAARGPSDACLRFADLLYADLSKYQPPQVPADDYISIAKSAFSVLWKSTDAMAKMDKTPAERRVVLSTHLKAVRFLVLLEHDTPALLLQEPPFFNSMVARHASAAAAVFEAQQSPMSEEDASFLSDQLFYHLVEAILERKTKKEPLAFQDCLCVFELTLIRSRYLCKSGCFRECRKILQQSSSYLSKSSKLKRCFTVILNVLSAGLDVNRELLLAEGSVGSFFSEIAEGINSSAGVEEPLLKLLAESCQLLITPLYGHVKKSKWRHFSLEEILGISAFMENYLGMLNKLISMVSPDNVKQKQALKKLMYHYFQLYTTVIYDSLQTLQGLEAAGLPELLGSLQSVVNRFLDTLEDLHEREQAEYLDLSAYCVSRLSYSFYSHKMYVESNSIAELFCKWLAKKDLSKYPDLFTEKLHNCFKLQVENYRKLGLLEEALQTVVLWLASYHNKITEHMAEPISSWVKVKIDASKNGLDDLRLKTLKEGLEGYNLDAEILVEVLLEELKAYKTVRVDTGQERFNVICDLLDMCSEGSNWTHERAVILVELAQVLCYHDYNEHTECSALDSIHEALQLFDCVPETLQNKEQLQDDKAQAFLWLYICTIEDKMHESTKQEQRIKNAQGQKDVQVLEGFETNDLGYENKSPDDKFLYLGIAFNLSADSVQSKCLDDAFALWKELISKSRIPAVRSIEQTAASLHIMAALYRVMGKPLQAMESYFLIATLFDALQDAVGKTNALCQIVKLLLQLQCPSYAEIILKEAGSCLQNVDRNNDSYMLMNQTLAVLSSNLCLANHKIEEGLLLLVETLQSLALQRSSKVWCLLRASALQVSAAYLGLPPSMLPLALRQKLFAQGWKTPEMALSDAHRLYRSILLNFPLINSDTTAKDVPEHPFVDHGDNLVQKWQVLADMFTCSESFVSLLGKIETISEAKAFCLETLKISMKLQSIRWCARFLVLKSGLELQCNNLESCHSDLEQVLFLLESSTVFEKNERKGDVKIKPKKRGCQHKKLRGQCLESSAEEPSFLKEVTLEFVDTISMQKENSLTASPVLRPKLKKSPSFLSHPKGCHCSLCSDMVLSAICLCWLVTSAEGELAFGNKEEGLHLLEATLQRCATVALRISSMVAAISQSKDKEVRAPHQSSVKFLDDLVAHIYVTLVKQSMNDNRPEKRLWRLMETGLTFLSSKGSQGLGHEYERAKLLLAKAVTAISVLASGQDGCAENIISSAWSWKSPLSPQRHQENKPAARKTLDDLHMLASKNKIQRQVGASRKAKPKRIQGMKLQSVIKENDVFALPDSDSEAPPVILRPPAEHRTPAQQSLHVSRTSRSSTAKPTLAPKAPFVVFEESSPKLTSELPKAPKVTRRMKSRIKVNFSDDSDDEDTPETIQASQLPTVRERAAATHRRGQKTATFNRKSFKMNPAKMTRCSGSSSDDVSQMAKTKSQPGRPCAKRGTRRRKQHEEIQKASCKESICRTQDEQGERDGEEEKELLRTVEEGLEASFEVLRGSDEGDVIKGSRRQFNTEDEQEILRRDVNGDLREFFKAANKRNNEDPFDLGILATSLDTPATVADFFSMDSIYDSLQVAFHSVGHYPPGTLYSHLCQLMALCIGSKDPFHTAYLVSESVAVTLRHKIMTAIHRKLNKMKKASVASAAKQLEALSLQEGKGDSRFQHLSDLESVFEFKCLTPADLEAENFKEQMQQIPQGVTVCILTLVSIRPDTVGEILLLTRLEKDADPVTIQIQTTHAQMSLSAALSEFDDILQKQKEISNFTEKEDWWTGRITLDKRMKALTESLETHVLGCWKGALLPACEDPSLVDEVACLQMCLKECGCEAVELALLKAMLTGSHLLTPQHVWRLTQGLNPAQPERAQNFLQEAVNKLGDCTGSASNGHVILVLDKHLQKLPWENIPCLRSHSVTRLPSLRFLPSYSLTKKYQEETVLNRGVNSTKTFYVLNPHGNLPGTEKMFEDWFQREPGWAGVVGQTPDPDQVPLALEERDLYIYAGHGAGARFVDSILKVDCRSVALLFGCSSAALAVQGNLEGTGAVLKFLMAGCPLVLGNLWDVTDRDIDRFMQALLKNWLKAGSGAPLLQHVIQSRQAPRLKYMIGAAPIAYGLPVSLQ